MFSGSKKQMSIYIALLAIILLTMFVIKSGILHTDKNSVRDLPEIQREGTLRIGLEYNGASYFVSGDTLTGSDYELCKIIERKTGLRIEIYPEMNLSKTLERLNNREYDIVARLLPITTEVKERFSFTEPLIRTKQVLIQRTAAANEHTQPIRNLLDLAGKTIHIPQGSGSKMRLSNLSEEIADSIYLVENPLYGEEQLIIQVAHGEIDYTICDIHIGEKMQQILPQIDIQTAISFNQFRGWALRKESVILLDSLNKWLHSEGK